jgi:hypothetical protein
MARLSKMARPDSVWTEGRAGFLLTALFAFGLHKVTWGQYRER